MSDEEFCFQASGLDNAAKRRLQAAQIHSYFYGGPSVSFGALAPHSMSIPFPVLSINRVGEDAFVPLSALPIGHTRSIKDTQLVEISPMESSSDIMNKICALPQIEGARRAPKKRKRTASPPPAEETETVKEEETAKKEASVQPEPAPRAGTADLVTADTAPTDVKQDSSNGTEPESSVKKEEQDNEGTNMQAAEAQNGVSATAEEAKEDVKEDVKANDENDDPYADYTEEEKQQLVEDAIEDSEVACSPVLGFVHM